MRTELNCTELNDCAARVVGQFAVGFERAMGKKKASAGPRALGEVLLIGLEGAGKTVLCRHLEMITAQAMTKKKASSKKAAVAAAPACA